MNEWPPFVRVGAGPTPLVVLPGLSLLDEAPGGVTGARLGPAGREICTRWLALARERRWPELHGELGAVAVDGRTLQGLARALFRWTGRAPTEEQAADFATTVAADLAHDTRARLGTLRATTLVLGGAVDPFFPEEVLRETADALPDAELRIFPRNGHGVPKHKAGQVQSAVADFLSATAK